MTYSVELAEHYVKDAPKWYRNIWNACASIAEIEAELLKFNGVYKMRTLTRSNDVHSICPEVSTNHYVEFNSEADYVFCLLRWS